MRVQLCRMDILATICRCVLALRQSDLCHPAPRQDRRARGRASVRPDIHERHALRKGVERRTYFITSPAFAASSAAVLR